MATVYFDILSATAVDLQRLLEAGQTTSVQIVEQCLAQIERHEPALNALASVAPRHLVLEAAASLDEERHQGCVRSVLHGIPIVLKDSCITASELGMTTCAGAVVFASAKARHNCVLAQKLIDAGAIILAKGNMTEFAGMKTLTMMPGWSAYGGQTISPYVGEIKRNEKLLGHSAPGGSSTGSAVSVAAGFSPLAIGAETIGSIITPSVRMALYALKPTVGVQDTRGMYKLSEFFDAPGPMAKCAADLLNLSEIMLGRSLHSPSMGAWSGLTLAFVDPAKWRIGEEICEQLPGTAEQMREEYEAVISKIKQQDCIVKYSLEVAETSELVINGKSAIVPIAYWDFKNVTVPEFIQSFDECSVASLGDIIKYNEENSSIAMPEPFTNQAELIKANGYNQSAEEMAKLKREFRILGRRLLNEAFDRAQANLIVGPGDSSLCVHAAAAGYPIAAVPLAQLRYNGRPFGLCVLAKENREDLLLQFATAFECLLPSRPMPQL